MQTYLPKTVSSDQNEADGTEKITGQDKIHPTLTLRIENDRCFGCHSRSGRIALNYVGLAEVEKLDEKRINDFGYLPDKRLVEKKIPDVHSQSGMACIDCHTVTGLMGTGQRARRKKDQIDIQCEDCHLPEANTRKLNRFTPRELKYFSLYRGRLKIDWYSKVFTTIRKNTPLFHIREQESKRILQSKVSGRELEIPLLRLESYHTLNGHQRLSCDSCHAAWAPQCYGCHVNFEPEQSQWDHLLQKKTKGRWVEQRWHIMSGLPTLGVTTENTISTFIPGMNLTIKKGPAAKPFDQVIYSPISPHTTQKKSRSCKSCHQSGLALGIIKGWSISPQNPVWKTPVGWIEKNSATTGISTQPGARSLNHEEIGRALKVGGCLNCHQEEDKIFLSYNNSLKQMKPVCSK